MSSDKKVLGIFSEYTLIPNSEQCNDLLMCFEDLRIDIIRLIENEIETKNAIKWYMIVRIHMSRIGNDGLVVSTPPCFSSKATIETRMGINLDHVGKAKTKITDSLEKYNQMGSGWKIEHIVKIELKCAK